MPNRAFQALCIMNQRAPLTPPIPALAPWQPRGHQPLPHWWCSRVGLRLPQSPAEASAQLGPNWASASPCPWEVPGAGGSPGALLLVGHGSRTCLAHLGTPHTTDTWPSHYLLPICSGMTGLRIQKKKKKKSNRQGQLEAMWWFFFVTQVLSFWLVIEV